jgi:hypothetical protein
LSRAGFNEFRFHSGSRRTEHQAENSSFLIDTVFLSMFGSKSTTKSSRLFNIVLFVLMFIACVLLYFVLNVHTPGGRPVVKPAQVSLIAGKRMSLDSCISFFVCNLFSVILFYFWE